VEFWSVRAQEETAKRTKYSCRQVTGVEGGGVEEVKGNRITLNFKNDKT